MKRVLGPALIALLLLTGCSNEREVGAGIDVESLDEETGRLGGLDIDEDEEAAGGFLGEQEQTEQARQEAQAQQQQQEQAGQEAEQQRQQAAVSFDITSSGYDPYVLRVFVGGVVSVTNRDSQPRSVTADRGEFDSGPIAPGATWTYQPETAGKYNFHDGTRPFVVGSLEVLAR